MRKNGKFFRKYPQRIFKRTTDRPFRNESTHPERLLKNNASFPDEPKRLFRNNRQAFPKRPQRNFEGKSDTTVFVTVLQNALCNFQKGVSLRSKFPKFLVAVLLHEPRLVPPIFLDFHVRREKYLLAEEFFHVLPRERRNLLDSPSLTCTINGRAGSCFTSK